jgi:anti-anti-sigma factor
MWVTTSETARSTAKAPWLSNDDVSIFEEGPVSTTIRGERPTCEVSVDDLGTTRTVTARGELDLDSAGIMAKSLLEALSDGLETVVLDLSPATFIDSTAVAVVFGAATRSTRSTARFVVIPGPPGVQQVFEMCGLLHDVPFASDAAAGS